MATIIDLLMSAVLGGTLLILGLTTNEIASESTAMQRGDVYVQESMIEISQIIESDLRNMGFGVPDTSIVIVSADTSSISYRVVLDTPGVIDTVSYFLGPTTELTSTPNELDRFLYRQVKGAAPTEVGTVTRFRMRYLRRTGDSLTSPVQASDLGQIYQIETLLEVQNPYAMLRKTHAEGERDALYSSILWKQSRLTAQNLRR